MRSESSVLQPTPQGLYIRAFLAELLGRYSHLKIYVDQCAKEARGRSPHLFAAYSSEIEDAIGNLVSFAPGILKVSDHASNADLFGTIDFSVDHSQRFQ